MSTERVKASPLAKKVADSLPGIDLTTIRGSGPGGRIVEADVRHAKPGSGKAAHRLNCRSGQCTCLNRRR